MRKLATIRKIDEIRPIPDADKICTYVVGGWTVVDVKDKYSVGDLVIMCEIDSWIPDTLAPFLSKGKEPREYNGVKGERLRTVKLRGQVSQGLLLPIDLTFWRDVDTDLTEALGIQKYEAPIPACLAGEVRGMFPSFIPKTDQERIQNLTREYQEWVDEEMQFEVTEKLDGGSMTVYHKDGVQGVCSRNLDLKETEQNTFWRVAKAAQLHEKIGDRNLALQGELVGEGIQGNRYKLKGQHFFVYDIYDIDESRYLTHHERVSFCSANNIAHVPVMGTTNINIYANVSSILADAEGTSDLCLGVEREGLVFKGLEADALTSPVSFKAISNKFLLKGGE